MNGAELIDAVAGKADLSIAAARRAVYAVLDAITDALETGGEVRLVGFGTFSVAERAAKEGHNPRTGAKIQIAASKQAKFKPGKRLRDELNPEPRNDEMVVSLVSRSQESRLAQSRAGR